MTDKPQPGETVKKAQVLADGYNTLKVVPDDRWDTPAGVPAEVADDEYVVQSMNSIGIISKESMADTEKRDGQWYVDSGYD